MASLFTRRLIIVVNAASAPTCNTHAKGEDERPGERGDLTFTVGLSATGAPPATHYWCSWAMTAAQESRMQGKLNGLTQSGQVRVYDGNAMAPELVLAETGLRRITN